MPRRANGEATEAETPSESMVEERTYRSESVYLCLLVNRRTGLARAIDFRAGPLPAKRLFIQTVARETGLRKVITFVEKDEVSTWTKLGFVREGSVPGFYKRSDGHLCGCVVDPQRRVTALAIEDAQQKRAERTIAAAKKLAKELPARPRFSFEPIDEAHALAERDEAWRSGSGAVGAFDPFGREAARRYWQLTPRAKGRPNVLSAEYQECFGHALVEVLRSPETPGELASLAAALRKLHEALSERGIVSFFSFAPLDDERLGAAFSAAGYRRTGLLASALPRGDGRCDAILWSAKATPSEDG